MKLLKLVKEKFNDVIDKINALAEKVILPQLNDWKVNRIDYTVDIATPYVQEYINLFKRGFMPKGFRHHKDYDTSIYLVSKKCRINFYDKISELKDKNKLSNDDIESELGLSEGILRLEIQCDNKKIQQIKENYDLPESSIECLWNEKIAFDIISHYIKAIVGEEDCYTLNHTLKKIGDKYKKRTCGRCSRLVTVFAKHQDSNLADMENIIKTMCKNKKDFNQLIFKIRRVAVNPIPLEAICDDTKGLKCLTNPYNTKALRNAIENKVLPPICSFRERWGDRKCFNYCAARENCPHAQKLSLQKEVTSDEFQLSA